MTHPGETSRDLHHLALGAHNPGEPEPEPATRPKKCFPVSERLNRRRGFAAGCTGVGLIITAIIAASWTAAGQNGHDVETGVCILATTVFVLVAMSGVMLLGVAAFEGLLRYPRAMDHRVLAGQLETLDRQCAQGEELQRMSAMMAAMIVRVEAMEQVIEKVPAYTEAVLDGVDLARGIPAERPGS